MGMFSTNKATPSEPTAAAGGGPVVTELAHTKSDPEAPAMFSAASAPPPSDQQQAGDTHQKKQQHLFGLRAKSDPTGDHALKPQKDCLTPAQERTLAHVKMVTRVMDNAVTIPVIGRKVGLDAVIGLVPYAGDMAGATVGTYIITRALKFNMPKRLVVRMLANQAIDSCVGIVPFLGDIFDIGFKANTRNVKLLEEHLQHPRQAKRADTCFLCGLFFAVVVLPMMLVVGVIVGIIMVILAVLGKL